MIKKSSPHVSYKLNSLVSPAHADFMEAINFAIMYKLYKEQQNIQTIKPIANPKSKSNINVPNKSKKGSMFQRPVKTKTQTAEMNKSSNNRNSQGKKKERQDNNWQREEKKQLWFDNKKRNDVGIKESQSKNNNHKSLNQFVSQLSIPTANHLHGKMDESYQFYVSKSNSPIEYTNNGIGNSNYQFDFNSNNTAKNSNHPNNYANNYSSSYNNNNTPPPYTNNQFQLQKKHSTSSSIPQPQKPKTNSTINKNKNRFQVKKKPQQNTQQSNQQKSFQYQSQKYIGNSERQTELESVIKSYKEKVEDLESQLAHNIFSSKSTHEREPYHIPQFGMNNVKITDWTKKNKPHMAENQDDQEYSMMYESQKRDFYQPSPTKSSSLKSETKSQKHKAVEKKSKKSSSEEEEEKVSSVKKHKSKNDSFQYQEQYQTNTKLLPKQVAVKQSHKQKKYQKPSYKKQPTSSSQEQPNHQDTDQSYISTPKNPNKKVPYSPSPSPQQLPKPTSSKPPAPKIPYSTSQKQICKFSNVSSNNQESFDEQFMDQLKDLNNSKRANKLEIDLTKHVYRKPSSSEQQEEEPVYYQSKPNKVSHFNSKNKQK